MQRMLTGAAVAALVALAGCGAEPEAEGVEQREGLAVEPREEVRGEGAVLREGEGAEREGGLVEREGTEGIAEREGAEGIGEREAVERE